MTTIKKNIATALLIAASLPLIAVSAQTKPLVLVKLTMPDAYRILDTGIIPQLAEFKGNQIHANERVLILDADVFKRLSNPTANDVSHVIAAAREAVKRNIAPPGFKRCGACGEYIRRTMECEIQSTPANCDSER